MRSRSRRNHIQTYMSSWTILSCILADLKNFQKNSHCQHLTTLHYQTTYCYSQYSQLLKTKKRATKKYGYSLSRPTLNTVRNIQFKVRFLRKWALNNLSTIEIQRYFIVHIHNSFLCGRFFKNDDVFTEIWKLKRKVGEN